jgi:aconitase A
MLAPALSLLPAGGPPACPPEQQHSGFAVQVLPPAPVGIRKRRVANTKQMVYETFCFGRQLNTIQPNSIQHTISISQLHLLSRRYLENKGEGIHNIILAGESYGQGSSREHASMCPMYLGVKAVIAKSFERIHSANLVIFGMLPLVLQNPADYEGNLPDDGLSAENWREAVTRREAILIRNKRSGATIECGCALTEKQAAVVLAGGLLNHITRTG